MGRIKAVAIDLDGTCYPLTEEIQGRIRSKIYSKISKYFQIEFKKSKELFEESYERLKSGSKSIAAIATKLRKKQVSDEIVQEAIEEADILDLLKPNYRLNQMLARLDRKIKIDLITGNKRGLTKQKLERLEINENLFTYILTREKGSKSTGALYKEWLTLRKTPPQDLLYVGDNHKQDSDIPQRYGIKTCIIGNYKKSDFRISSILELENLVNSLI